MKRIFSNAKGSLISSAAGCFVGLPDIIEGISKHDWQQAIKGFVVLLWGLATNEKQVQPII